ncbi:type II secretion system F family protein [Candidatus Woesearchaeota archaeon]|nr:type II secretion system F family protein [Candidatus Woesearchaeota archaeon]
MKIMRIFRRKKREDELKELIKEKPAKKSFKDLFKKKGDIKKKEHIIKRRKHKLGFYLTKAGLVIEPRKASRVLFNSCVVLNFIISIFLIFYFSIRLGYSLLYLTIIMAILWFFAFIILLFAMWSLFYIFLDLKIFKRRIDLEGVLPDFLQLTSANIKAGMSTDKALWYAVRPRFGVLAKEIEAVAKETMGGKDLREALLDFTKKYDSLVLKRSISLIIEGINAGGEIGDLLNKVALNIQESAVMKKEMAANVTTYVIFITFATVVAAPFLFALSSQLIAIVQSLTSRIAVPATTGMSFALSFTGTGIKATDFKIFAVISLIITSFFSSLIVATIKKGDIKEGIRYIPLFMASTVVLFFLANILLNRLLGIFF